MRRGRQLENVTEALGDRVVICYTKKSAPDNVFFRVIRHGALGPVTEITIAKGEEYNLWSKYMALYAEGDRIWFSILIPEAGGIYSDVRSLVGARRRKRCRG